MNEHDDVMCQVRESFSVLRMDMAVEDVFARSRVLRRRRLAGLTVTGAAVTAGAAAAAMALALGGPAPTHDGPSAIPAPASPPAQGAGSAKLTAFTVTSGPGNSTTLILRKGAQYRLDPDALRQALAGHGIPALVTVGTFCSSTPASPASLGQVLHETTTADGSALAINGQAIPPGSRLSIGYFLAHIQIALIADGGRLSCSSTSQQPAVHILPSGTAIRGGRSTNG
jgi:hypothetical protein